ncbi:MAG TPA: type II secretion system F family protein [Candidatus Anoxymicrobiaceae bacterium]
MARHLAPEGHQTSRTAYRTIASLNGLLDRAIKAEALEGALKPAGRALDRTAIKAMYAVMVLTLPALATALCGTIIAAPPAALLAFALPRVALLLVERRTATRIREQTDTLASDLSVYLRCGIPIEDAIDLCGRDIGPPLKNALDRFHAEVDLGISPGSSLLTLASSLEDPDLDLIAKAAATSREMGSDIRRIMGNIGETVRERAAVRRELQTQTVQGRMSARIVAILPFLFLVMSALISRATIKVLVGTVPGLVMLGVATALDIAGFTWLRRIMDLKM